MEDLGELELDLDVDPGSEDAGAGANIEEKTLLQETHMALQQFSIGKRITYRKRLVLGRTQFVGSEFGIFGGFGWVRSSVLVGKPGFGRVRSSDLEFGELWRTLDILFWT